MLVLHFQMKIVINVAKQNGEKLRAPTMGYYKSNGNDTKAKIVTLF